jgi:hypothetical protein
VLILIPELKLKDHEPDVLNVIVPMTLFLSLSNSATMENLLLPPLNGATFDTLLRGQLLNPHSDFRPV